MGSKPQISAEEAPFQARPAKIRLVETDLRGIMEKNQLFLTAWTEIFGEAKVPDRFKDAKRDFGRVKSLTSP